MKLVIKIFAVFIVLISIFNNMPKASPTSPESFYSRTIQWSGYTWEVKAPKKVTYPGPNYWSGSKDNVYIDRLGRLHLKITKENGVWKSSEIVNSKPLGYGTYRFYLESNVDLLDPNAVFGMFTYDSDSDDASVNNYREIDIEFSRWGEKDSKTNTNYTVQPYTTLENNYLFHTSLNGTHTNHSFTWKPNSIHFASINGHNPNPMQSYMYISKWDYTGKDIPDAGKAVAILNLWLVEGKAPMNHKEVEVIVKRFEFIPLESIH